MLARVYGRRGGAKETWTTFSERHAHRARSEFFVTREQWPPLKVNRFRGAVSAHIGIHIVQNCTMITLYIIYNNNV